MTIPQINSAPLVESLLRRGAKHDMLTFIKYIDPRYETPPHIKAIAQKLQDVASGKIKRLIINMPPRHGKSMLASQYFAPWLLGNYPQSKIIICSYASNLATTFTRRARDLMLFERYADLFNVTVSKTAQAADRWETAEGGIVIGAGVGGGITGHGATIGIIDDPVKDMEEALSRTIQEKTWDWYKSTFYTRLEPNAAIILIQTRWSENDLTGKILENEPDGWEILKLPAVNEKDEALWADRFPLTILNKIRINIGERIWYSLYQQEPIDISERIFENIKYAKSPNDIKSIGYLDPALGGKDYSALTIGGYSHSENKFYIIAGLAWQRQLNETYDYVQFICESLNVNVLAVESNQAQIAIGLEFKKRGLQVTDVYNFKNKHFRVIHFVKKYWDQIFFESPDEITGKLNFDTAYIKQILHYSEVAEHDDAPDSLAGFMQAMFKLLKFS